MRAAMLQEIGDRAVHQALGLQPRHRGQDDQTGVQVDARREMAEIFCIFGDDDAVLLDGACKDNVVRLAQTAAVARMDRVMHAALIEVAGKRGRDAFVDEELQAADPERRSLGLPTWGCVSA